MIINVGSVGNPIDVFRNNQKDGDVKNTTVANYLILSGNFDSKNINEKNFIWISMCTLWYR